MARKRTERRTAERAAVKGAKERLALAAKLPGGSPQLPLRVTSASLVEPTALGEPCVVCGAHMLLVDHEARVVEGTSLRIVTAKCHDCGTRREIYVQIVQAMLQ